MRNSTFSHLQHNFKNFTIFIVKELNISMALSHRVLSAWLKLGHFHIPGYGPDWLAGIVTHGLDLTNNFRSSFIIRTIRVNLLSCHTFVIFIGLIQLFWILNTFLRLTPKHWNLYTGAFGVNAKQYSMSFPNFWWSELHYGAAFLTVSAQLTPICRRLKKTETNEVHEQNL